jgi:hypothetical protein
MARYGNKKKKEERSPRKRSLEKEPRLKIRKKTRRKRKRKRQKREYRHKKTTRRQDAPFLTVLTPPISNQRRFNR